MRTSIRFTENWFQQECLIFIVDFGQSWSYTKVQVNYLYVIFVITNTVKYLLIILIYTFMLRVPLQVWIGRLLSHSV